MKILQIIDEPWDSGISHYALTLSAGLKNKGHQVHVWALPGKPPYQQAVELNLSTYSCKKPWIHLNRLRRYLIQNKIELINAHTGSGHSLAIALSRLSPTSIKIVRTRGDLRPLRHWLGSRMLYRQTHGFIAANTFIQRDFETNFAKLPLITKVIHQGLPWPPNDKNKSRESRVESREFSTNQESKTQDSGLVFADSQLATRNSQLTVGMVARLDPVKGHEDFLRAAALVHARYPDTEFLVAGREENITIKHLQELSKALSLEGIVRFLGHIPDVSSFMRNCNIGIIASRGSEAVCRVALEWMASGKPVVATQVGSIPELMKEGLTGYLTPPSDPHSLGEKIMSLLKNPEQRKKMGRGARKRYETYYNLDIFTKNTEEFYRKVCAT
ncbi:MAG: glycosyltransferase family 4 protein [Elusimicrobia bacterium]|nr:glycosyltransferase family 4 protein [Elusimicrobiota bacterium]